MTHGRIAILARAPVPGKAKTRLIPALGATGAAALHTILIRHTLGTARASGATVELWCHPDVDHPMFSECRREFEIECHRQQGDDLGARMMHAASSDHGPVILIGTDCPTLTSDDLQASFDALKEGHDAVLGPAFDGGYYLLGLNRSDSRIFSDMAWGSDQILTETRRRFRSLGWRWDEITERHDLDVPDDLIHLPRELRAMLYTRDKD